MSKRLNIMSDPAFADFRARQAHIDADIEGLARDPAIRAWMDQMEAQGVPTAERIARLGERLAARSEDAPAAAE